MKSHVQSIIPEDRLDERLNYWMQKLNLMHWDIKVRLETLKDMGTGKLGRNNYSWTHMESRIALIHPDDHEDWGEYDMEFILVHELLHLIIDVQYPVVKGRREIFSEQAINQIARSFVQMDRELANAADVTDKLVDMVRTEQRDMKKKKKKKVKSN